MPMTKERVLVSACLLGENCKYNGGNNKTNAIIEFLKDKEVFPVCPEVFGGLPTPRLKNEIILSNNQRIVINENKEDVSEYFIKGALISLKKALDNGITLAILKQKSPSCGYKKIYNGNFDGTIIEGNGIFTDILLKHNIKVLTEEDFKEE